MRHQGIMNESSIIYKYVFMGSIPRFALLSPVSPLFYYQDTLECSENLVGGETDLKQIYTPTKLLQIISTASSIKTNKLGLS